MDTKRRDRVAKACALCRRKKTKCDGEAQCANCVQLNTECVYVNNKVRKPRLKSSDSMALRMAKLEQLVVRIAERVELAADDVADGGSTAPADSDELSLDELAPLPSELIFQQCKNILTDMDGRPLRATRNLAKMFHYKGHHLGISMVFSAGSIEHLRTKLPPQDHHIMAPLETLPFFLTAWKRVFQRIWQEPQLLSADDVRRMSAGVFPEREIMDDVLEAFEFMQFGVFVCEGSEVRALFDAYFENKRVPASKRRKFSSSELMLMTLVVVVTLLLVVERSDTSYPPFERFPRLMLMPLPKVAALHEKLFTNIVYYYHRVCIVSEGIITIQALLLMVMYLDTLWVMADVNHTLIGLAVRYAQELGLHRFETSEMFPPDEQNRRARVWEACQMIDSEIAYRLGKPPLINIFDLAFTHPLLVDGWNVVMHHRLLHNSKLKDVPFQSVYRQLLHLRSISYLRLFSSHVDYSSLRHIQDVVTELNQCMAQIAERMDDETRVRFFHDPNFERSLRNFTVNTSFPDSKEFLLTLHLTYFHHVMTINRCPSIIVADEASAAPPYENLEYRRLSNDAARTILHIIRAIDPKNLTFLMLNYFVIYPFAATLNLLSCCLNHADDTDAFKDLSLLIDVLMNFYAYLGSKAERESTRLFFLKPQLLDLITRIMLRVVIKVVEERTKMNILDSNPALREHLESVERTHPQFYKKLMNPSDISHFMAAVCEEYPRRPVKIGASCTTSNSPSAASCHLADSLSNSTPPNHKNSISHILTEMPGEFKDLKDNVDWTLFSDEFSGATAHEFMNMPNLFYENGL